MFVYSNGCEVMCSELEIYENTQSRLFKMLELAEMAKLTYLVKNKTISIFMVNWTLLVVFLYEKEEK